MCDYHLVITCKICHNEKWFSRIGIRLSTGLLIFVFNIFWFSFYYYQLQINLHPCKMMDHMQPPISLICSTHTMFSHYGHCHGFSEVTFSKSSNSKNTLLKKFLPGWLTKLVTKHLRNSFVSVGLATHRLISWK